MQIMVSKNLLSTIQGFRLRDWHETVSNTQIFEKIKEALINDQIIFKNDDTDFEITNKEFQGVYIPSLKKTIHFCQMAKVNGTTRSRNTFLNQNFPVTYRLSKELGYTVSVSLNPYDIGKKIPIPSFIENSINELLTLEVSVNTSLIELGQFKKFNSLNEYLSNRTKLRETNKGNESTLLEYNSNINSLTVYGRLDGASGPNTWIACNVIKKLSNQLNLQFFDVSPEQASASRVKLIKDIGFEINNTTDNEKDLVSRIKTMKPDIENFLKRDQDTFKANIIRKYINVKDWNIHKCMACNYSVEENFIGSHIYRYTDIVNDFKKHKLTPEQAAHLIVSGDNGFLLCPNQDKEFEKGQIYFDLEKQCFIANKEKLSQADFDIVKENIVSAPFQNIKLTPEFKSNVMEHHKRIGLVA